MAAGHRLKLAKAADHAIRQMIFVLEGKEQAARNTYHLPFKISTRNVARFRHNGKPMHGSSLIKYCASNLIFPT